jgi:phage gp46-like protein
MSDFALRWNNQLGHADLVMTGADLLVDDGLETAVIISMFTDRRANDDDVLPQPGGDLRGWWGDSYAAIAGDKIGSRRWLLERAKALPSVYAEVQVYDQESLQWLIDDGVVSSVGLAYSSPKLGWLRTVVTLARPSGAPVQYRFDYLWGASA